MIGPLAVLLIFIILFALYGNFKFPVTVVIGVVMTEPVGALLALKLTHTTFSVSSVLGLLVLMGVSAETAIIDVSYINKLRLEGQGIRQATLEGSLIRLRPIMMTALVACLGLLPAALSTGRRLGLSETVRHRHRGGTRLPSIPRPHREPGALPDGGPRGRRAAGLDEARRNAVTLINFVEQANRLPQIHC